MSLLHQSTSQQTPITLLLEDGTIFPGFSFGAPADSFGEIVFNTGMVGYPESFTDPSYRGQILVLTYPLIGNYGVPDDSQTALREWFESDRVQISGLVVSEYSETHYHWQSHSGLSDWLVQQGVPGICGVDTRALTKHLRSKGTMRAKIIQEKNVPALQVKNLVFEPKTSRHVVSEVSVKTSITYDGGKKRIALIDCGCKNTIIHSLMKRGATVIRVPWNYDVTSLDVDGVLCSNGPGDPTANQATIRNLQKVLKAEIPLFGICLGNQLMSLAVGAKTYKLKFGHRSQNQPCFVVGTKRCYITSQNHGYAVDEKTLPSDWEPWFENANDGSNEGLRHKTKPFMSVQFHPEAMPGPVDTAFLFDEFLSMLG
ncbi:MAG: carbamoyl-phosphate synthase (glutamine-hydrolyzing) small subunit [Deltaproteobacteria bacterium CG_4_10_14_0_2_um_filter_43_8]|nr:MAG: carbamoyl phosphate synthase small subunit [Deltaproteobacteria bacterium CG11_big_fil_rev_8_21_14_0_20_42_23]PJA22099.1 MAG: carbamoyl-phosphate synthase (glutamine-hydrolyzing) small subunit [Deltaproteobacteria bacterium CG_4_10_14_0_2_um_filter_43_8]PJC63465.1 MAG: carbamoyl-phosphate synthase (glutamine-hydrolyzing) small subunit [Deltaproteobacteria bacterium CG_4_9_14_0_2_um_filter_42_21]